MNLLRNIRSDEAGFVISAELVLVATVVVIGMTVGLTVLRNQVVQELVDVGQAIGSLNQSYAFAGVSKPFVAYTGGSYYVDKVDFCQDVYQAPGTEPGGISVRAWPWGAPLVARGGELWYEDWCECEETCPPGPPLGEAPCLEPAPWGAHRPWPAPPEAREPRRAPPRAGRLRLAPPDIREPRPAPPEGAVPLREPALPGAETPPLEPLPAPR